MELGVPDQTADVIPEEVETRTRGVDRRPLVISDQKWKGSLRQSPNWASSSFDDSSWKPVESLGSLEGSIDLLQWNADAGLYEWPGYDGISPFLAHLFLPPVLVSHVYAGSGALQNVNALTEELPGSGEFSVQLPADLLEEQHAPQILLDFGREVSGRLQLISDSNEPSKVTVQYGESQTETLNDPYLGIDPLYIPPKGVAYGPKSAFRYALVRFVGGASKLRFKSIRLDAIYYPVKYQGSFESSDAQLNLMWAIGAYTAHLCMQDDIWDAPKRDRERWMGDLDVSGRTINDVFADHFLMEDTLERLMGPAPIHRHINGIAGYSAFWITGEAEYYQHSGSRRQLESVHGRLVQLMDYMETELDQRNLFTNQKHSWLFVDWSPELNGDTLEARRVTQFEFYAAIREGVYLLKELGDTSNAQFFERKADELKEAAQRYLLDSSSESFGTRWQTNAYAVLAGVADPSQYAAIWHSALSSVGHVKYNALFVTPYYNYYVVSAMAKMGRRQEALNWIREYWGGMVNEGATSFWEGYDPSWFKGDDFHASLQADNLSGYSVSLAHGWSSGVTPWLMEQVLGINVTGPGFSTVDIRPDLIDLQWVKGGEPTPRGILTVAIRKSNDYITTIDLPAGTVAKVSVPVIFPNVQVMVNGKFESSIPAENGTRAVVVLRSAGHYDIESR